MVVSWAGFLQAAVGILFSCWMAIAGQVLQSRPGLPLTNTLRQLADHRGVEEKLHC